MTDMHSRNELHRLYHRWIEELWSGKLDIADELVDPRFVVHDRGGGHTTMQRFCGPDGVREMVSAGRAPFEEMRFRVEVSAL